MEQQKVSGIHNQAVFLEQEELAEVNLSLQQIGFLDSLNVFQYFLNLQTGQIMNPVALNQALSKKISLLEEIQQTVNFRINEAAQPSLLLQSKKSSSQKAVNSNNDKNPQLDSTKFLEVVDTTVDQLNRVRIWASKIRLKLEKKYNELQSVLERFMNDFVGKPALRYVFEEEESEFGTKLKENLKVIEKILSESKESKQTFVSLALKEIKRVERTLQKRVNFLENEEHRRNLASRIDQRPSSGSNYYNPGLARFKNTANKGITAHMIQKELKNKAVGTVDLKSLRIMVKSNCKVSRNLLGLSPEYETLTNMSLKSSRSYICTHFGKEVSLFEDGEVTYWDDSGTVKCIDSVYASNYYYLLSASNSVILRKSLDSSPPTEWLKCQITKINHGGKNLRTALHGKALVLNQKGNNLVVIEITSQGLKGQEYEFEFDPQTRSKIKSFEVFGNQENKIAMISTDGTLILLKINPKLKKIYELSRTTVTLLNNERPMKLCVCPNNEYLSLILTVNYKGSRVLFFRLSDNHKAKFVTELDVSRNNFRSLYSSCFYEYYDSYLVLTLVGNEEDKARTTTIVTYCFDLYEKTLVELEGLRRVVDMVYVYKFQKLDGVLYSLGDSNGRATILEISYKLAD